MNEPRDLEEQIEYLQEELKASDRTIEDLLAKVSELKTAIFHARSSAHALLHATEDFK